MVYDDLKIMQGQSSFTISWCSSGPFTSGESAFSYDRFAYLPNKWIVRFELLTNSREISVDGVRFDVMAHEDNKEAERFGSWFNRKVVDANK